MIRRRMSSREEERIQKVECETLATINLGGDRWLTVGRSKENPQEILIHLEKVVDGRLDSELALMQVCGPILGAAAADVDSIIIILPKEK